MKRLLLIGLVVVFSLPTFAFAGSNNYVDPQTGKVYVGVQGGAVDPQTGQVYPSAGRDVVNPKSGAYYPSVESSPRKSESYKNKSSKTKQRHIYSRPHLESFD